ncbi:hypothetical protein [Parvularcula maris]|uniref:Uncharacterized protein n=1 Tax=Parvularcula maris TaxID=2965077 RepID=A0A9X2LAJ0_9PROT|nr:hypothetical protein [Parvularcula maris]MCQ8185934.1 hypothetical protein [Parvularcula maris]
MTITGPEALTLSLMIFTFFMGCFAFAMWQIRKQKRAKRLGK